MEKGKGPISSALERTEAKYIQIIDQKELGFEPNPKKTLSNGTVMQTWFLGDNFRVDTKYQNYSLTAYLPFELCRARSNSSVDNCKNKKYAGLKCSSQCDPEQLLL